MFGLFGAKTPAIKGARAIAQMEKVQLGGIDQWVVTRGHDTQNPVLIYLHGGPGGSDYATVRKWNAILEERYTIVHWCQRGANKSYSKTIKPESMNVEQFISDLHELVLLMTRRFNQRKVFIAGQSVGSIFGLIYAQRHPELVHAFVGINQVVARAEEERISYEFTLEAARKRGNQKAVALLEQLGAPVNGMFAIGTKGTFKQREWLSRMGLVSYNPKRIMEWQKAMIFAPELTWGERFRIMKGVMWSMEMMWPELGQIDFRKSLPEVQVPVYFIAGRQDHITNLGLTEEYITMLKAPKKELVIFEHSGHIALFEEPEKFNDLMINVVRKEADTSYVPAQAG